jgi:DNA repair exonuclease SbcCD nuclease subunit
MKLAICSDIHLHSFPQFATLGPSGFNTRLWEIYEVAQQIIRDAAKAECKGILFAGDWFHTRLIPREVLDLTGRILTHAHQAGLTVAMVPGNHDMSSSGIHALRSMGSGVKLLDENPVEFGTKHFRVSGLAYSNDREELLSRAKLLKGQDVLVIHAPCIGAEMASDIVTQDEEDTLEADQILQVSKSKLVIAGHYHKPQIHRGAWELNPMSEKWLTGVHALVPGAPCQHCFGDRGQSRGWWELDCEKMALRFHPLKDSPHFLRLTYKEFLENPTAVLDAYIQLEVPEETPASERDDVIHGIQEATAGLQVQIIPRKEEQEAPRSTMKPGMNPMELVGIYAEKDPPPDKERAFAIAKEILEKAN